MATPDAPIANDSYQDEPTMMVLQWQAPPPVLSEEGEPLPILRYCITCADVPDLYIDGSLTGYKVRGLQQTMIYQFSIAAENANGRGSAATFPPYQPGCHKYGWV